MSVFSKYSHVLVLGRGGFGTELGELLQSCGWGTPLYLDDQAPGCAGTLRDYVDPVLRRQCPAAFVALGNSDLRLELLRKLAAVGYRLPVFEHPAAVVSPSAALGRGTVVLPVAFVGAGVKAGTGCLINAGAIVDHNATLEDGVHVAPGAIVKAGATVPAGTKVESGQIIRSPWDRT